jgi:MFS transporter, FSR family, fosmidomycin resistance protein
MAAAVCRSAGLGVTERGVTRGKAAPGAAPATVTGSASRRALIGACTAHLLHDGYTDQLYAYLPVWQHAFGLSYAGLAIVRALYYATMGVLQVPADRMSAGLGARTALAIARVVAAAGFAIMALPLGLPGLCLGLVVAGVGSSLQHPRASLLITHRYGTEARGPLGIYNFAGDLGKAAFPAAAALLLPLLTWRPVVGLMAAVGVATALALLAIVPAQRTRHVAERQVDGGRGDGRGFPLLFAIGVFDTATRMAYLLFLPFLLRAKGGHESTLGLALALLFAGGAFGKAACGWLGQRLGVVWCVIVTESATAVLILATLVSPLHATLGLLLVLGTMLNGTSSVLYGTVPDLAREGTVGRAFAVFYTGVIGSGGLAPILFGVFADHAGRSVGIVVAALTALAIVPMVLLLRPRLVQAG